LCGSLRSSSSRSFLSPSKPEVCTKATQLATKPDGLTETGTAISTETGHESLAKVASDSRTYCGTTKTHSPRRDTYSRTEHTEDSRQELAEPASFRETGMWVRAEVATKPLCQSTEAVNLVRCHVHQHGVFAATELAGVLSRLKRGSQRVLS
jgi:hypothetical protein